ncbi:hypothetical protein A2763_01680 [Candidatus Kaiserbacteria bacterium RIFCSPHIGHO2_01_FULL_54_36]|uniref:Methyltransferase type 11 domain-containing protein n=1 Tax=Candidatus Kaiserbacteria bacterium RIFCSPHIGHO2_01_FULL_54_36 TaxID=1798482 RepID=A0A1F6CMV3_9BACT|nr:MAG: hypothetical protein A2763_01680 [Candidatus Kaiserbacteria bacterium RIFCSPHIGHO2_01_FULL_54_36]OGG75830.1 MAG: hypothetical protein A3A41_02715 [Candidatus Kaiserbacteria bacterium RIFCSPLOWO2_01_FULL_54_22]
MQNICPLCGSDVLQAKKETHEDGDVLYTLYHCAKCGVEYWLPLKNPGANWYAHDERYAGANENPPLDPNWNHKKAISFLKGKKGRVLDVGCGTGNFLSWANKNGWEVWGIDFDPNAAKAAREVFGLPNISLATLAEFIRAHPELTGTFDLVTFFDVFEHIDDHNDFAALVSRLVKKGGHIAMSMPYRKGARWLQPHDLPPRHLTRWDRSSLMRFWGRHGFSAQFIKRVPASLDAILMKFRFTYGKAFSFGLVRKAQMKERENGVQKKGAPRSVRVRVVHALAKAKDAVLFGIPALLTWLALLPSEKRYTTLYLIARKEDA